MERESTRTLATIKAEYDAALKKANDALDAENLADYDLALNELTKLEKEYSDMAANAMYSEYSKKDNPLVEIVKAYSYETIGHRETRDKEADNRVVSVDGTVRLRTIDLLKFCKVAKLSTHWSLIASKFNQLMCLRVAKNLGADYKSIAKSYVLEKAVEKIELGETPTSNTQICKLLQKIFDDMLPHDKDKAYKVNNYDVFYLDELYGRKSNKALLTVKVSNDAFLRRILVDIAHRLVTDGKYGVDGWSGINKKTEDK